MRQTIGYHGALPPAEFNMARYCIGRPRISHAGQAGAAGGCRRTPRADRGVDLCRLQVAVLNVAGALSRLGLAPGARILVRLDNTSAYALMFFGAVAAGLVPIPASTQLTEGEVAFLLADSGAQAVCLADDLPLHSVPAGVRIIGEREVADMIANGPAGSYAATLRRPGGVPDLHLRHHVASQGRAARASRRLGPAADVPGLVRHRAGRPHAARRRLQLDLYPGRRPHRSLGQRRHRDHLHRPQRPGVVAGPDRRAWRDASSPRFPASTARS